MTQPAAPGNQHADPNSRLPAPASRPPAPASHHPVLGIVVNHTHWDREWYMPFQRYRVLLVDAVDMLLHLLATREDYQGFMLDGQTVVAEDYLEVRPDRRAELEGHIRSGRIALGPWYVLPDEFIPGGESLIRNLMLGRKQLRELGAAQATVGYLPDTFGHPAQLPQILAGFDLDSAVIFRGVQSHTSEFIWEAPDGTRLLTVYLPGGYYNAMDLAMSPRFWLEKKLAPMLDQLLHFKTADVVLVMNGLDHLMPQPATQQALDEANRLQDQVYLRQGTLSEYVDLVRPGMKNLQVKSGEWRHNRPSRITPGVLSARMYLKQADFEAATLLERGAEPLQALDWATGGGHDTALLWTAWRYLLQNHPHDSICGCSVDAVHRDCEARFRWATEIAGDLIDRAARSISARIAKPRGAGFTLFNTLAVPRVEITRLRLHFLQPGTRFSIHDSRGSLIPYQELSRRPIRIDWDPQRRYFHPSGRPYPAVLVSPPDPTYSPERWQRWFGEEVEILLQADMPAGGYTVVMVTEGAGDREQGAGHRGQGAGGRGQGTGAQASSPNKGVESLSAGAQHSALSTQHSALATQYPGPGTQHSALSTRHSAPGTQHSAPRTQHSAPGAQHSALSTQHSGLVAGEYWLENEYLRVEALEDGSFALLDKESGRRYGPLNVFLSEADRGDEYSYCPAEEDAPVTTRGGRARLVLVETGPLRATLAMDLLFAVPSGLAPDRRRRLGDTVELPIHTRVSLSPGSRRVEVSTRLENRARDHRLRALFATGVRTAHADAQGQFQVVRREAELPADERARVPEFDEEQEVSYHPQRAFVDVSDEGGGLALLNRGLPEYEAYPGADGITLGITLLRCVGWLSRDDLSTRYKHAGPALETPEAQCLGTYSFDYAVMPHAGNWLQGGVHRAAEEYVTPVWSAYLPFGEGPAGGLPVEVSFYRVETPELLFSACKRSEAADALVLRLYNTADRPVEGLWQLGLPGVVRKVNLAERELTSAITTGSSNTTARGSRALGAWAYQLPVEKHEIVSLAIRVAAPSGGWPSHEWRTQ